MTARELVNRISLLDMVKQLGDRLTVGQRTLTPPVLVRIQVPQPPSIPAFVARRKAPHIQVCTRGAKCAPRGSYGLRLARRQRSRVRSAEFEALNP